MGDMVNGYMLDIMALRARLDSRDQTLIEIVVDILAKEFDWDEAGKASADFVREAARNVIVEADWAAPNSGWVYYALMRECPHTMVSDGWRAQYNEDVLEYCRDKGLSEQTMALLQGLARGRAPNGRLIDEDEPIIACFVTREEAEATVEELLQAKSFDPDSEALEEQILFNDLLPALDRSLPEGHGFVFYTL